MKKLLSFILISTSVLCAQVGESAPDFRLTKLGGGTAGLSDFEGKVLYIFWFGYGCPYCDDNMRLAELNVTSKFSSDVFAAIGIDTWSGSNPTNVAAFQASTANSDLPGGVTFPLLIDGINVASDFGVTYDRSMVIDQQGIIRYYGGSHSPHNWSAISSKIQELLTTTGINESHQTAFRFELKPNYPNPFNPETHIPFTVDEIQTVKLEVYNINGRLVKTIVNAAFAAGSYNATWEGRDSNNKTVASGIYFIRLQGEKISHTRQIILIK